MPNSKIHFGEIKITNIKFGLRDAKVYFGSNVVYPTSMPIDDAVVTCDQATYNGSNQTAQNIVVTFSGKTLVQGVDYVVSKNSGGTNVGTYDVEVSGTGFDYEGTAHGTFTINKVTPTVTTAPSPKSLTYNTSAQSLVDGGVVNFGTLKYSLDNTTYTTSIPSGTNAQSYTVWYRVDGDSNVNSLPASSVTSTISAKTVNNPTITLATTAYTYDGTAKEPSVTSVKDGSDVIPSSEYNVNYSDNTNAGTATVTIADKSGGNYIVNGTTTFIINKAKGVVKTAPTAITGLIYNTTAQELVSAGASDTGTMMYKLDSGSWFTAIPTATNATSYTVYYKSAESANYTESDEGSKSCSIAKVTPTVTAPTPKTLTYNTSAQVLANAGSTNYGTIQYCLNNSGGTYSTTVPSATNANVTYKVWYKVVGNSNVNDVAPASIDCMIAEKRVTTPTITLSPTSYTYNGSAQSATTVTVKDGSTVIPSSEYTIVYSNNTNAGTATCTIDDVNLGNYYISGSTTFTINKASGSVTITPTAKSLTYNGSAQALVNAGSGTGTMMYKLGSGSWGTSIPTATNATSYTVYYKASASTNYNESASGSVSVTINKVTPTVTAPTKKSLTYNGSAQALYNNGSTNYGTIQYCSTSGGTYGTSMITATNAGSYDVWYKVVGDSNINDVAAAKATGSTIGAKVVTPTISVSPTSYTYDGSAKQPTVTLKDGSTTIPSSEYTVSYSNNTNAGTATATATDKSGGNYSFSPAVSQTFTINKQSLTNVTITLGWTSKSYNSSVQVPSATVKSGTSALTVNTHYTLAYSNSSSTNAGTYSITANPTNNYSFTAPSASYTINKIDPTYTAPTAKSGLVYNRSSQTLYNAGSNTTPGSFSYTNGTRTNAGSQNVTWTFTPTDTTNYNTKSGTLSNVTIAKATPVTATSPSYVSNWVYDATAHNLLSGGAMKHSSSDSTAVAGTFTYDQGTNVGTYSNKKWYFTPTDTTNYNSTNGTVTGSVTCNCKPCTAPTKKSLTYNGSAQALVNAGSTSYGTMVYSTDNSNWSTSIPSGTNATSYTVYWKVTGNTNVCCTASSSVACSISCKSCTAPTAKSLTYNGSAQALVNAGSTSYGTMVYCTTSGGTYSTTIPTGTNAGSYEVWWKVTGNTNVCCTAATKVACTIAKAAMSYTAPKAATRTYNTSAQQIVSGQSATGGNIYFATSSAGASSSTTVPTKTDAGTYTTYWKAVPDNNHSGGTSSWANITGVINPASCCSTAPKACSLTYTSSGQNLVSGGSSSCGTMQYATAATATYSTTIPTQTNAGTYTTYWKVVCSGNYSGTSSGSVSTTIAKRQVTCTAPSAKSLTWNGSAQTLANAGSVTSGTMTYCSTSGGTYSSTIPTGTAATGYTVWYKSTPDSNHSGTCSGSTACSIGKKTGCAISFGTTAVTKTYGNAAFTNAITNTGDGTVSWSAGTTSVCTVNSSGQVTIVGAGSCTIKATVSNSNNCTYSTTAATYTITVNKANGSVTTAPVNSGSTYNSGDYLCSAGSGTGTMMYKVGSGSWSSSRPTASSIYSAGSYTLYYKASASANYNESASASTTITVAQKTGCTISLSPTSKTVTYGDSSFNITLSNTGDGDVTWSSSNTGVCTVNTGTVTIKKPGSCNISASTTNTTNCAYSTSVAKCAVTVNKETGEVTTSPTAKSLTYNGSYQELVTAGSGTGTMLYKLGSGSWSSSIPTAINASSYTVYYKASASTYYTESSSGSVTCTISKADGFANISSYNGIIYDGNSHELLGGVIDSSGQVYFKLSGTSTWSTAIPEGSAIKTYKILYRVDGNSNYNAVTSSSTRYVTATILAASSTPYDNKVQYLETNNSSSIHTYIDTGIVPNEKTGLEASVSSGTTDYTYHDSYIIACRTNTGDTRWGFGCTSDGFYYCYGTAGSTKIPGATALIQLNKFNNKQFIVVSGGVTAQNLPTLSFTPTKGIRLFGSNGPSVTYYTSRWKGRIYYAKITQGDAIIMDLIPVKKNNVGYMYDLISGSLYGNNGNGSFTIGPVE